MNKPMWRLSILFVILVLLPEALPIHAQLPITNDPPHYGPFNVVVLPDGKGLSKPMVADDSVLRADSPWSLYCWINTGELPRALSLVAGIGDPDEDYPRFLALIAGRPSLFLGK